ncbi:MAG TPA: hypothetical protein VGO34_03635 [Alphaproteobacteria bacterium]|jgi:hypothetical protein
MSRPPQVRLRKPPPRVKAPVAKRKPALAAKRKGAKGKKRPSLLRQLGLGFAIIAVFIAALPSAVLLCFALLPTMCAFMVDRLPQRYATRCVGALNFAGTWPYLLNLWRGGHTMVNAVQIMIDPTTWLVIYGAAAAGWLCFLSFPAVTWALMDLFAGRRIGHLRREQKKLIEEWGEDVARAPIQPMV